MCKRHQAATFSAVDSRRFGCGRGGYVVASIGCSFSRRDRSQSRSKAFCFKTIILDSEAHPFVSSAGLLHAVLRWIRAKR